MNALHALCVAAYLISKKALRKFLADLMLQIIQTVAKKALAMQYLQQLVSGKCILRVRQMLSFFMHKFFFFC